MEENVKKPIVTYCKRADKALNKIIIPKAFIESWGNEFLMEVYENKIVLIPTSKIKKEGE